MSQRSKSERPEECDDLQCAAVKFTTGERGREGGRREGDGEAERGRGAVSPWLLVFLAETCCRPCPSSGQYAFLWVHLWILPNIHHSSAQTDVPRKPNNHSGFSSRHSPAPLTLNINFQSHTDTFLQFSDITDPYGHQSDSQMESEPKCLSSAYREVMVELLSLCELNRTRF